MTSRRILIVLAHPEPQSLNGHMARLAQETFQQQGHQVTVSDLYAMKFDPVSDRRNFLTTANADIYNQQAEETFASAHEGYQPQLQAEMDKLAQADALILQFPIWWLGMPAIMKGWVDRTFAVGRAYGGGKYFEQGRFAGKRAMISLTVAGPKDVYSHGGFYAPVEDLLFPIHRGILGFTGFTVVEPYVMYAPSRVTPQEREVALSDYVNRLKHFWELPTIAMPNSADYQGFKRK